MTHIDQGFMVFYDLCVLSLQNGKVTLSLFCLLQKQGNLTDFIQNCEKYELLIEDVIKSFENVSSFEVRSQDIYVVFQESSHIVIPPDQLSVIFY